MSRPEDVNRPAPKENPLIARTALMTAKMRAAAELPYARRIYDLAAVKSEAAGNPPVDLTGLEKYIPGHEIRPLLVGELLNETSPRQVLDLGGGLTSRGLVAASDRKYVEVDLPAMTVLKREIVTDLLRTEKSLPDELPNHYIEAGNILNGNQLMDIAISRLTPGEPVDVVLEGVLHSLTKEERKVLAENIKRVFGYTGDGRIITDMPVKRPDMPFHRSRIAQVTGAMTGVDIEGNQFETNEEAAAFFKSLGLRVTRLVAFDSAVERIASPQRLGFSIEDVAEDNLPWYIWVIEPSRPLPKGTKLNDVLQI